MIRTKIRIFSVLAVLITCGTVHSQQLPQYSQYMLNDYVLNPAIAGIHDYYQVRSNYRYQWTGIVDAPRTYTISVFGPHKKKDMGFGGYIFNDVTGPTSRIALYGSYAYNIMIQQDMRLSFGLNAGLIQYKVDGTKITLHDTEEDVVFSNSILNDYLPDATFGLYFYTPQYYVGFSAAQLIMSKINFKEVDAAGINKLTNHFHLIAGYKYSINEKLDVEPSVMLKYTSPATPQVDINAKIIYLKNTWGGISYRTKDAVSILLGYIFEDQLYFGYSYDFNTSTLSKYSSGSHELMFGIKFNKYKEPETPGEKEERMATKEKDRSAEEKEVKSEKSGLFSFMKKKDSGEKKEKKEKPVREKKEKSEKEKKEKPEKEKKEKKGKEKKDKNKDSE